MKHYYVRFSARFSVKIVQDLVSCHVYTYVQFHFERSCKFLQEYVPHHARILQENGHITCKCKICARFMQDFCKKSGILHQILCKIPASSCTFLQDSFTWVSTLLVVGVISYLWCAARLVGIAHHSFYSVTLASFCLTETLLQPYYPQTMFLGNLLNIQIIYNMYIKIIVTTSVYL